ncbi:hypothetical protein CQW23_05967 [Capsicum baccatum]|uniref:Pentatricopeptide repeat-containing protein n=1 Tax=Capsicum baccatum TaxID=33114 RepID=A0A2G2X1Z7_CAPBA|nr:hypothetical protein CQW23_05967 [Capsicum baccatum]
MLLYGLTPDSVTYNLWIGAACNLGLIPSTLQLHDEMLRKDCQSYVITYSKLLILFCLGGMMREADKLFRKFLASDLAADHVPILVLMKRYCKMGEFNKVFELCQKWLVTLRRLRMLLKNYCEVKGTPNVLILEDKATKDFAPGWLTNFRSRSMAYKF